MESFNQAAFEAGFLAEINERLSSPITSARVVVSEVKTIVWDEHNLPSNYDYSYGTSTRVAVELTVTGGDAEAGVFSAALHNFTESELGLAINETVLDLGSIAARAYLSAGGDATCDNNLWEMSDGNSFTSTVALRLTLDKAVDDFTTAAQASLLSQVAPLVYADAERVRIESVSRSGTQTDVVVEVAAVSDTSAIQLSTIWLGEAENLFYLSITLGETVVASTVPIVRTLLLDGFASPSPSPPPPLPRPPPQVAAPPQTMTFGACAWEVVREYVEVHVVVHEPIETFETKVAQAKSKQSPRAPLAPAPLPLLPSLTPSSLPFSPSHSTSSHERTAMEPPLCVHATRTMAGLVTGHTQALPLCVLPLARLARLFPRSSRAAWCLSSTASSTSQSTRGSAS